MTQTTEEVRDRVVLVGLSSPVLGKAESSDETSMEELEALVETAGAETVGVVWARRRRCSCSWRTPRPPWSSLTMT